MHASFVKDKGKHPPGPEGLGSVTSVRRVGGELVDGV
jgi:hypothetical protein